jgi:biopolymer transport protein ExbB/TolQ
VSPLVAAGGGGLAEALARIASSLRIPVLILALLVLLVCAVEVGRFATELYSRARAGRGALRNLARQIVANPAQAAVLSVRAPSAFARAALLEIARAILAGERDGIEHALADYELAVQRRLDHTRILVRAGPALGLMGTLIPLAPGLAALGHGEVSTLATDLRTAFAATTIGLLVGTVAFALTLTRTRMYSEDLTALERAVGSTGAQSAPPAFPTPPTSRPVTAGPAAQAQPTQVQQTQAHPVQALATTQLAPPPLPPSIPPIPPGIDP